jgi:hypothetical protein
MNAVSAQQSNDNGALRQLTVNLPGMAAHNTVDSRLYDNETALCAQIDQWLANNDQKQTMVLVFTDATREMLQQTYQCDMFENRSRCTVARIKARLRE